MKKAITKFVLIYLLMACSDFAHTDDKLKMEPIFRDAQLVVPQKTASVGGFLKRGNKLFFWDGSREFEMNKTFNRDDFLIQSKGLLLTGSRYFPDFVTVYDGVEASSRIPVSGFEFLCHADKTENRLFLAGLKEKNKWLFRLVDDSGELLNEFDLDYQDRTTVNDQTILYSLLDERYWFVWIPSHSEILVFDHRLKLLRAQKLTIPNHLQAMNLPFLKARHQFADDRAGLIDLCSSHAGETMLTLPRGFFQVGRHVALCFDVNRLEGCREAFWREPEKFWRTRQSSEILYLDKQTFEWELQTIPDLKITGLFGLNGNFLGYRMDPDGKTWAYQLSYQQPLPEKQ